VDPRPRLLGNRYELQTILASGGMGRVWRAHDSLLNRPVAVKVLRSEYTGNPAFLARFRAEAQHAAALHHPHIAAVFDYGEITDDVGEHLAYLVMELVEGDSLAALLHRERRLDVPRTLTIVRSTAAALGAAHAAGVVHRDVKPGNVLVRPDGVVKITDFGIAWSASSAPLTQTGQVIGTAHYLSPEQAQGGKATPASDVYALGAVAYECLAGHRPFEGDSSVQIAMMQIRDEPAPLPPEIPDDVRRLVERAMVKDPAQRFPDGAALREAIDRLAAGRPSPTLPVTGVLPAAGVTPAPGFAPTAVLPMPQLGAALAPAGASAAPGRRALVRAALGGLAALVLVAVVLGMLQHSGSSGTPSVRSGPATTSSSPAPATTAPSTPPALHLVATDYLRHPVAQVKAALTALGLQVKLTPVTTRTVGAGLVTAIAPVGDVRAGSSVTVSYAVAPVATPAPAPVPQPVPAPAPKPHKKHGKGG
jgi:eukaryotic-like serine/threonine-protein kinase